MIFKYSSADMQKKKKNYYYFNESQAKIKYWNGSSEYF